MSRTFDLEKISKVYIETFDPNQIETFDPKGYISKNIFS